MAENEILLVVRCKFNCAPSLFDNLGVFEGTEMIYLDDLVKCGNKVVFFQPSSDCVLVWEYD